MGRADGEIERIEAEAGECRLRIREAGGPIDYCINYITHLAHLNSDSDEDHMVIRERNSAFPRMAVQLAAVASLRSARQPGIEESAQADVENWARSAWIHSAGHYVDQPTGNSDDAEIVHGLNAQTMAMIGKAANRRKAEAAEQWERLSGTDIDNLNCLALFGHEVAKPSSRKDRWIAYAILAGFLAAASAYGASNWYLSAKITAPYATDEGIEQRRAATRRALNYDYVMSSTARRSGIIKLFLDWPMSPTDDEQAGFMDLATDIIQIHRGLAQENLICGKQDMSTEEAMEMVENVNNALDLSTPTAEPFTRAQSVIVEANLRLYPLPCR